MRLSVKRWKTPSNNLTRKFLAWLLTGIIVGSLLLSCRSQNTDWKRYNAQFLGLFDTVTQITGYAEDQQTFQKQVEQIYGELEEYHRLYDIYQEYEGMANIRTINQQAGIAPVRVDRRILDLLEFGRDMYEKTNGTVNICMGSVLLIWHNYREQAVDDPDAARLPGMEELQRAAEHCRMENLIIDKENKTVFLADPKMSLDVGAIAKGYALEQTVKTAQEEFRVKSVLLSVGGNLRAIGTKPDGSLWNAGIRLPEELEERLPEFHCGLNGQSLVCSGDDQRYYLVDGVRYHHIIDPKTLMPAGYSRLTAIWGTDSGVADALSTAIFTMPYEEGRKLLESFPGVQGLWIFKDGTYLSTTDFT